MTTDLAVAFDGHGAFLQVHAFEHGVFAEAFLNIQGSLLQALFLCVRGGFLLLLAGQGLIIREEVQLQGSFLRYIILGNQTDGDHIGAADQQIRINDPVIKLHHRV